jgi:glutathione synthase/RimK-type ligase-like ATP-grasp enzyme
LGLGLYGVDLIETEEGPFVIDINSLPGYKGIEGAAQRVAAFILGRAALAARETTR